MTYSAQLRVLIVDDDFRVVRVHRNFVERVPGFTVVGESATGEEALTAIRELNPDLVLLDIYLPDKSGLEVLSALRQSQHPVDVLVVSAARDLETVRQAYHGGVVQYLVKPFSSADLEKRLLDYQRRRRHLDSAATTHDGEIAQDDIDHLFVGRNEPTRISRLPKGLTAETLTLVLDTLRNHDGPCTAAQCGEATGLARVTARRYLTFLVQAGKAESHPQYGQQGRPELLYSYIAQP